MKLSSIDKKTIRFYNQHAQDYSDAIQNQSPLAQIEQFTAYLKKSATILDVGCAAGRDSRVLRDKGFEVTGIDISKKLIELARSLDHLSTYQVMDMRHLKYSDESFDGVFASASILHLPSTKDVIKALKELRRVIKSNGCAYLSIKLQTGKGKYENVREARSNNEPRFFQYFTQEEISNLLGKSGFKLIKSSPRKSSRGRHIAWLDIFAQKLS